MTLLLGAALFPAPLFAQADGGTATLAAPTAAPGADAGTSPTAELSAPPAPPANPELRPASEPVAAPTPAKKEKGWWERIRIRGYTQVRYNRLFSDNDRLVNAQGDRYIGDNQGFGIRRARVILQGDVHDHLFIYLQPDFATVINDQLHVPTMRDWYADVAIDAAKTFRFRIGQSKVPFGFENMQSSQNRLAFDRSDALNSAVKDERDLGIFFYWAPAHIRERFRLLVDEGLKGSGDYGVLGVGVFNGQTANKLELNDDRHVVARVTWPFLFGSQYLEVGGGGYVGQYVVKRDAGVAGKDSFRDMRGHVSFVLYPQPFGIQAEYNVGTGPEFRDGEVVDSFLHGGYVLLSYKAGNFIPYARGVYYDGGKKFENNSPPYRIRELEFGLEYQVFKAFELTAAFTLARRTHPSMPYGIESGRLFRLQAQFNY